MGRGSSVILRAQAPTPQQGASAHVSERDCPLRQGLYTCNGSNEAGWRPDLAALKRSLPADAMTA